MAKKGNVFQTYILVGMVLAIIAGILVGLYHYDKVTKPWKAEQEQLKKEREEAGIPESKEKPKSPPVYLLGMNMGDLGDGFIALLKFIVIPLVITSMVVGVTSLGSTASLSRLGGRTVAYYFVTTAIAVLIGLVIVNIVVPGGHIEQDTKEDNPSKTISDVLSTFLPWNLVAGAAQGKILPLIVCSLVVGWVMLALGSKVAGVIQLFEQGNLIILRLTLVILVLAPFGVFGVVTAAVGKEGLSAISNLAPYFFTVLGGLALHAFIVLPLLLKVFGRRKVLPYAGDVSPALSMAFATASSSATLPVTMECVEEKAQVDKRAANFVLPLGATVNMDGTALYEAVAVMTIAQSLGMSMTIGQQLLIFITATLAAVGAAGIPQAGLVTMVIVLEAVGIKPEYIGTIFAIDWFLDRFRTTVNVWGDTVGAAVIARLSREKG